MKKIRKIGIIVLTIMLLFRSEPTKLEAASSAVFYVQTAAALEDNTIEVCIYLDEVNNLGGVDVELIYDPEKVTFISSSLGPSLKSSLSDIQYDEENANIHYVILYSESKMAHGILLSATFQLEEGSSYQPELIVNDLVDNTAEINDIPYKIVYQHADGTWADSQDSSGKLADDSVIEETLEQYGAPGDIAGDSSGEKDAVTVDNKNNISGAITEEVENRDFNDLENEEKEAANGLNKNTSVNSRNGAEEDSENTEIDNSEKSANKESIPVYLRGILIIIAGLTLAGIVILIRYLKKCRKKDLN